MPGVIPLVKKQKQKQKQKEKKNEGKNLKYNFWILLIFESYFWILLNLSVDIEGIFTIWFSK